MTPSDRSVSREQYELLLDEAQEVERERVRLEGELSQSAIELARLETELSHSQEQARQAGESVQAERLVHRELGEEIAQMRAERAVAVARLESLTELQERVRSLEEANNQLAFALRDAGQGFRQTLLEQGGGAAATGAGRPRAKRWVSALVLLGVAAALTALTLQVIGWRNSVAASEARALEEREEDRQARELLADELRQGREDSREWLETLQESQEARWTSLKDAAEARAATERAEAATRGAQLEAKWDAERALLSGSLEQLGAELAGVKQEAVRASEASQRLEQSLRATEEALLEAERARALAEQLAEKRRAAEAASADVEVPEVPAGPTILPDSVSALPDLDSATPVVAGDPTQGAEPTDTGALDGDTPQVDSPSAKPEVSEEGNESETPQPEGAEPADAPAGVDR